MTVLKDLFWSGRQDLNLRPLAPHASLIVFINQMVMAIFPNNLQYRNPYSMRVLANPIYCTLGKTLSH